MKENIYGLLMYGICLILLIFKIFPKKYRLFYEHAFKETHGNSGCNSNGSLFEDDDSVRGYDGVNIKIIISCGEVFDQLFFIADSNDKRVVS